MNAEVSDFAHIYCPPLSNQLTVEAWVESREPGGDGLQALVSKWSPPPTFDRFTAFDAGRIDGLVTEGYFGAVFDGRYVYFVPEHQREDLATHAVVLRYDTHAPFDEESSYAACDAHSTSGLDTRGFYGAAFDGRYAYFVPRQIDMERYHMRLLRLDTRSEFKDPGAWEAFDIVEALDIEPNSSQSCAFDGRYLYLCPGFSGDPAKEDVESGVVTRYDTHASFRDENSYSVYNLKSRFGERAACFDGGAFDGRYVYLVPLQNGIVVRYDTQSAFVDDAAWQTFDARTIGMEMCVGAVFDGRWIYFVPYAGSKAIRCDTRADFAEQSSWQTYDVSGTDGLQSAGFDGGHFDGRYVYFVPFCRKENEKYFAHSNYLRFDATQPFNNPSSWQACDASHASGLKSVGYNAGAFDGRYFYCAPWRHGSGSTPETCGIHGTVLRCDTIGESGSFSLRFCDYGHNGGLNAAVPGPSFLVNLEEGKVLSVAAHRVLPPGKYHLAGVYDGQTIKLLINGEVIADRQGYGRLQNCDAPVITGKLAGGLSEFRGTIEHVRISNEAKF